MRDYKQVNAERYEKDDFSGSGIEKNMYSPINAVGNYGLYKTCQILRWWLRLVKEATGKGIGDIKILDCGCGTGNWTRLSSIFLGNCENVYGFEFSENRLRYCQRMNPAINYTWGDIVEGADKFKDVRFDGVMAVDVLSQIRKEQDVLASLKTIWNYLLEDGLFLWYEINAKNHYMNYDADTQGFSIEEMDRHASRVGFEAVGYKAVYKKWTIFGKKFDTFYYVNDKDRGIVMMEILEKIIPFGECINICRVYKKKKSSE